MKYFNLISILLAAFILVSSALLKCIPLLVLGAVLSLVSSILSYNNTK